MVSNVDNNYAAVLFNIAKNKNVLQSYFTTAAKLLNVLENNEVLYQLITNASIAKKERKTFIKEVFEKELDQTFIYFLWTLIDFNRVRELINVIKLFLKLCQQYYGIVHVQVTSVYPLSENELLTLKQALKSGMDLDNITINNEVDPTLIGGIKLKTNAISIDGTIRNKLNKMRENSFKLSQQGE
ncbi:MAG: ATP synthase F1 subunit delta [Mycoplasmataceae bacterium]|nr:ATP synthase F1 subunit delta [Mycoplasmataceae bacterium]